MPYSVDGSAEAADVSSFRPDLRGRMWAPGIAGAAFSSEGTRIDT
jgi:hypothetical protein